jgi:hypothetical protein
MSATIRGKDVLEGSLTLPLRGVWVADLDVNATSLATGAASLSYVVNGAATTFQGTIVESSPFGGRVKVRLVGGAGKMSNELPALGYGQVPASTIVRDVVVAASEALADGVADELRDTLLPSWHRAKGSGTRALTDLAEHLGVGFRMLANGTVWLGKETWTQAKAPFEIHGPDANGLAVYGPVRPDLVPGTNLAGKRVSAVEFSFSGSLRANVTLLKDASGNSDRAKKAQSAFVKHRAALRRHSGPQVRQPADRGRAWNTDLPRHPWLLGQGGRQRPGEGWIRLGITHRTLLRPLEDRRRGPRAHRDVPEGDDCRRRGLPRRW